MARVRTNRCPIASIPCPQGLVRRCGNYEVRLGRGVRDECRDGVLQYSVSSQQKKIAENKETHIVLEERALAHCAEVPDQRLAVCGPGDHHARRAGIGAG
jgi:hypothetical protein